MGVLEPNDEEREAMEQAAQNQQPSPQDAYLIAEAAKSEKLGVKAEAETELTVARIDGERADTLKTLKEVREPAAL